MGLSSSRDRSPRVVYADFGGQSPRVVGGGFVTQSRMRAFCVVVGGPARHDCFGQWDGTDLERHPAVVFREQGRMALNRAWKTNAEWLRGEFQRAEPRRYNVEPGHRLQRCAGRGPLTWALT